MDNPPILNWRDVELVVLPPGKSAWPYHFHYVNEEMFLILEGEGCLRYDNRDYLIKNGDIISAPPGSNTAHQLFNNSDRELKYLAVSTMEQPDVFEYPDSGKFGVFVGSAPGGDAGQRQFAIFSRKSSAVDYWDGEDK